jgi:spermidine/putrescine transport system permease protein
VAKESSTESTFPVAESSSKGSPGHKWLNGFALFWGLPLILWQSLFFVVPVLFLILMTFWSVKNFQLTADYTTANWVEIFSTDYFRTTYFMTFLFAAVAALSATILAFPFSYALAFKVSPAARRFALFLLITPFFTSYLVRSYSWQIVLADNGLINTALQTIGAGPIQMLQTPFATLVGYLTLFFPLVTLLQLYSLVNVDRDLIEAANNLGSGRVRTVFEVVIPSARIGLAFSAAFAFILAFGDFIAPSLLGGGKIPTLSITIIDTVKSGANWPQASVIALIMVVTLVVVTFAAFRIAFPPRKEAR